MEAVGEDQRVKAQNTRSEARGWETTAFRELVVS